MPESVLPPNLQKRRHDDWPWPFKYIPRGWTSFDWGSPRLLWGRKLSEGDFEGKSPKPISGPGGFQVSCFPKAPWWAKPFAWYVAYSFPRRPDGTFHQIRLGARYDNVDEYTNYPTFPTTRRYSGDDFQNTQNWK